MLAWNQPLRFLGGQRTAKDKRHDKQRTSQVSPECHKPVHQHPPPGQLAVQNGNGGEQERTRAQVGTTEDNHRQSIRENQRAEGTNQSSSVILVPGGGVGAQQRSTSKGQQTARKDRTEEHLIQPTVTFQSTGATDRGHDLVG